MAQEDASIKISFDISQAQAQLEQLYEEQKKLNEELSKVDEGTDEYEKLNNQLEEVNKNIETSTQGLQKYGNSQKNLKQELRELTDQLQRMKLEGKDNSAEYQRMIARAGELKDAMGDTAQAINKTASDTANLDAVLGAASAVSGGFGLAVSTMSLLGADTEDVAKAQKRLQQAIALVNSVQSIQNALNKDSALMVKLQALSYKLLGKEMQATAATTNGATTAFKGLKGALISTGIGALVVALGFVVSKLMDYIEKTKDATAESLKFREAIRDNEKALIKTFKDSDKALQGLYNSQEKVNKAINDAKKAVKNFGRTSSEELKEAKGLVDKYAFSTKTQKESYEAAVQAARDANAEYKKLAEDYERQTKKGILVSDGLMKRLEELKEKREEAIAVVNEAEASYLEAAKTEQTNLLTILELEKKISDERKARKIEYDSQTRRNIEETNNLLASFVSDDPLRYYEQQQKNIETIRDNALAEEKVRYRQELENKELTNKEKERLEDIHNKNMYNIYLQYLSNLQAADDEYNEYLNTLQEQHDADVQAARYVIAQDSIQKTLSLDLQALDLRYQAEIDMANKIGQDTTEIQRAWEEERIRIRRTALNEQMDQYKMFVDNMSSFLGSAFDDNKDIQIATTVATTISNAAMAFGSTFAQAKGGAAVKAVQAAAASAAVIGNGMAAIKNIKNTTKKSQSIPSGTTSISGSTTTGTGTSSVSSTIIERQIRPTQTASSSETVLVLSDVEYKQRQSDTVKRVSVI